MDQPSTDKLQGALFGGLAADALCLGVHWIYDPGEILRLHGRPDHFLEPAPGHYHASRRAGEQTHYGDQTLALMRSLPPGQPFSLARFADAWKSLWTGYPGYIDGATRQAMANLEAGRRPEDAGAASDDIAGAARVAPLVVALAAAPEDELAAAARTQAALTHAHAGVLDTAEFFARLTRRVLQGEEIGVAMDRLARAASASSPLPSALQKAAATRDLSAAQGLASFGLGCHLPEALPGTLHVLLKHGDDPETALVENAMAGGDSAARGLLLGLVLGARHGLSRLPPRWIADLAAAPEIRAWLRSHACGCGPADNAPGPGTNKLEIPSREGHLLSARLEWPPGGVPPRAVALFAHCFTCTKDLPSITRISRALAENGIAVLRLDFTGLGASGGDFASTNFSSNIADLLDAAAHLKRTILPPRLLIGHSLGGSAVIAAAGLIGGIRGIVTIGAPAQPRHLSTLLASRASEIESEGEAVVEIGGRPFTIRRQLLEDLDSHHVLERLSLFPGSLLILHSPADAVVAMEQAEELFLAARQPKSLVALEGADHLLSRPRDSAFAAEIIAAWAKHLDLD